MTPLANNPLEDRADFQNAVRELYEPLAAHRSSGGARVKPGPGGALFPTADAGLEGFARPLWGLVPLAEGDGSFADWAAFREGLTNGTDPDHPEYWGPVSRYSQKAVEMAPIAYGLSVIPELLWEPLSSATQERVAEWLYGINDIELPDSNWLFFRVLTNVGLRSIGADHDPKRLEADLDRLASFYRGNGWYADGEHFDYYGPWAIHLYGLLYDVLTDEDDRSRQFRTRADDFAAEFRRWFGADGSAVPYGRSLTYRFAQGGFWGALAYADLEALPWGEIRGLWQRNLQWWAEQPIFTDGGVLSVGYRYPTNKTMEDYNSPSSPYWAFKYFLPLALPASHPFWRTDPAPLTAEQGAVHHHSAGLTTCHTEDSGHVVLLSSGQYMGETSGFPDKYSKFAYSNRYGFAVADSPTSLQSQAPDSTLLLSADGTHYRRRTSVEQRRTTDGTLASRWRPWDSVTVDTWLVPSGSWHVRVHQLETQRELESVEGGFPFPRSDAVRQTDAGIARIDDGDDETVLVDASGDREGDEIDTMPNTNVLHPRTEVPLLRSSHDPGTHVLATAAYAGERGALETRPSVEVREETFRVCTADGTVAYEGSFEEPSP
ncbi:DUF2264 domain-containing protein [Salinarchaeum laminariae]|uniref:DUF2264 domain-containing protein n=1 Tax=Salinarchaeum laminariae TaxID=869888 RepID=UPI0020BE0014|nr:DUF2264 domain-containing protein [Salinarchaeum laminariae]